MGGTQVNSVTQQTMQINQQNDIHNTAQNLLKDKKAGDSDQFTQDLKNGYLKYVSDGGTPSQIDFALQNEAAVGNVGPSVSASPDEVQEVQSALSRQASLLAER